MYRPLQLTHGIRLAQMVLDLAVLCGAYYLAFALRFDGNLRAEEWESFGASWPVILLVQYFCLVVCKVSESSWRYISLLEVRRITTAMCIAAVVLLSLILAFDTFPGTPASILRLLPPRGVIFLDLLVGLVGVLGLRASVCGWLDWKKRNSRGNGNRAKVRTLLIGAGSVGADVVEQIAANPQLSIEPVGFLDDDPTKRGMGIHGVRVLGTVAEAKAIAQATKAKQALVTIGDLAGENLRRIVELCKQCGLTTKVIPGIRHILEGKVNLSAIREVAIEDLLHRDPVQLDIDSIAAFVQGRRLLVTGAGGSIGSELCRIVCRYGPASLVLVEHTENNLFHIHRELVSDTNGVQVIPCLADICEHERMQQIFATYRPDMVLHAAAYKHVPMIEWNPGEAIKNNVLGTKMIADLAHAHGVSEFVMISTDKAVNPTSIMGTSKRIAEIYIQALSQRSPTRFVAVRFGNVLGSAGSVIPTFKEQIARGGPVTVTHPEMKRYFMTIPEACQLVLQAATMGRGGEIFILDMGDPVKIVDLARNLIGLSGFGPDEIEICFTGMRPGEKLFEELALKDEIAKKTRHPKIFIGRLQPVIFEGIDQSVKELQALAHCREPGAILRKLKEIVPEFEGCVMPPPPHHAALTGRQAEHHDNAVNGNGKVAENGSAKRIKSPILLNGVKRTEPASGTNLLNGNGKKRPAGEA